MPRDSSGLRFSLALGLVWLAGCDAATPPAAAPVGDGGATIPVVRPTAPVASTEPAASAPVSHSTRMPFSASYSEGYQQARSSGKPLLVFFTAKWCRFCHEMQREAFVSPAVVQLAREFVCVAVDADEEPVLCEEFAVRGFPTVQFVSPDGVQLNRLVGRSGASELVAQMQAAIKASSERMAAVARENGVR